MNGWERTAERVERGPVSAMVTIGCLSAVALVIVGLFVVVGSSLGFIANPFKQAARVINKTIDADNVIYNYEWFKRQHESIGAIDGKIAESDTAVRSYEESLGDRKDWDREDKIEHSRLESVLLGLRQQREDMVAEYNARSRMANRNIFKAGDIELPERIE